MRRKSIGGIVSLLAAAVLLALVFATMAGAQAPQQQAEVQPGSGETPPAQRERQADPNTPAISFIDSPTATCFHPVGETSDACYIEWSYLNVSASTSQYIISMTVEIDGRKRAYYSGFFQTSMYVPSDMHPTGFRVSCGPPGSNPVPGLGRSYSYTLRARETGGLAAANYGSVTCPAGPWKIFLPISVRR
jgi:hypothetical protein